MYTVLTWFVGFLFFAIVFTQIAVNIYYRINPEPEKKSDGNFTSTYTEPPVQSLFDQRRAAQRAAAEFAAKSPLQDKYDDLSAAEHLTKRQEGYLAMLKKELEKEPS